MHSRSKNIAFTICSNNYLSQAKVMADSFKKHHPDASVVIGLVDKPHDLIDYSLFDGHEIIRVDEIGIDNLDELSEKYHIVELNTAVKPSYFQYLFKNRGAEKVIYLDPDIEIFSPFEELLELLDTHNIVITPQNCAPIDDGDHPDDLDLLGTGVFNLGFIGLSHYEKVSSFLSWWHDRNMKYGYSDPSRNMFYDQLWINLVPAFFDNYYILKHPGYNMSPSNLHERKISDMENGIITINGNSRLRFYHFSGFKFLNPEKICSYSSRFNFESRPDIKKIYEDYFQLLKQQKIEDFSKVKPVYSQRKIEVVEKPIVIIRVLKRFKRAVKVLLGK